MPSTLALSSLFSSDRQVGEDDDRLLDLYWNRAQLKKEYAALRKERFKLLDSLTEQEGKNARLQQKLEYLEDLLTEPETASNTVAFYTLKKLWRSNQSRLVKLAKVLRKQQEASATKQLRDGWKARNEREQRALKKKAKHLQGRQKTLENEHRLLVDHIDSLNGLFQFFKKRRATEELEALHSSLTETDNEITATRARLNELQAEKCPEFERLSLNARRKINATVIALAEKLAEHYTAAGLLDMARMAQEKSVGTANFGAADSADATVKKVHQQKAAFDKLERGDRFAKSLRTLAAEIAEAATYAKTEDATPSPGSLNGIGMNVLARDIWNVSQAMML